MRLPLVCLGFGLALFAGACVTPHGAGEGPEHMGSQLIAPVPTQSPVETIARYEDARTDGDGLLETLLTRGDPKTRERAAVALGRLNAAEFGAPVTEALCSALADESPAVRAAAAFALGERGDKSAAGALLAHARDADPVVRARIVEAGSRIDDPRLRTLAVDALDDRDPRVRTEAVLAPARFAPGLPDADAVDSAIIAYLSRTGGGANGNKALPDEDARWRGLFTLSRRKSERARALFLAGTSAKDARVRIFALQGLGNLAPDDACRRALRAALADRDWRVVCEAAVALGKQPDLEALSDLAKSAENASPHVRRCVFAALGSYALAKDAVKPLLERAHVDPSSNVRAAAVEARARLFGEEVAPELELAAMDKDPLVRAGAAAAAAFLPSRLAVPALIQLSHDANLRVAGIAVEGFAKHGTDESRARLMELLRGPDNGLRLAAVQSLREMSRAADLPALAECMATSQGEISAEIAASVVESAAKIGGDAGLEILKSGLAYRDPFVRRRARELLAKDFPNADVPRSKVSSLRNGTLPLPPEVLAAPRTNPRIELKTSRGTMVFELFADEAPVHVYSFLQLAGRHFYDGLTFHRVVPDFVIQGGDARGDGNGGSSWRGDPLRAEFTPRKFVRGSLGMPRNDDPDSGGSQFFVTHRETPHLDGRYTLFGELREGFDVLDAIEVGDTILGVRLLEPVGGR